MAKGLTFFWRAESTTFSGTDDFSAGDSTPTANGSPAISSTQARVGTNSVHIDGNSEHYAFDKENIIAIAEGSIGFSFYASTWEDFAELVRFVDDANASNTLTVSLTGTDEVRVRVQDATNGATNLDTTAANLTTGNWYGCVVRWHAANQDLRLEVYNSSNTLIQAVENLAVTASHFTAEANLDEFRVGDSGSVSSGDYYIDNIMVSDRYNEPLENNFTRTSYTGYLGGRVWVNDAATWDSGAVEQTHPGAANWSDTSIDMQSVIDTTGLSGQLYVLVEAKNGDIASQAITVNSADVTGSGTPAAQAATAAGTGERTVTGTGTPGSQAAIVAGTGGLVRAGTGVLTAQAASASGTGTRFAGVTVALTVANNRELVDATGTAQASINNWVWEWYDTTGSTSGNPVDSGTFNTNASGEATISIEGSALADGEFGQLIVYHPSDVNIRASLRVPVAD